MTQVNFRSDNEAPVAPEIMAALERVNAGSAHSYGEDAVTARLQSRFSELFEKDVDVFPVVTGTAANALALAQLAPPYGAIYCHENAHMQSDECGAPEFFTGGAKVITIAGQKAKIPADTLARTLAATGEHGDHESKPSAISLSLPTELGTIYRIEELGELSQIAHDAGLGVHVDGARLANAIQRLRCSPADITWRAGVDLLSFGATKNGALAAEAVVVFHRDLSEALGRRRKRAGHLLSKMRYVSAQLEAYVSDDLWLRLAARANQAADRLAAGVRDVPGMEVLYPVEANEVFVRMSKPVADALKERGYEFHRWPRTTDHYRFVLAYDTQSKDVDAFVSRAKRLAHG